MTQDTSRSTRLPLWVTVLLGAAPMGCTGTETGNPSIGKVSLSMVSSDLDLVSVEESEAESSDLRVVEAKLGLGELIFEDCEGNEEVLTVDAQVIDLAEGLAVADTPVGTFCEVRYDLVATDLSVPSLDPAWMGEDQSLSLRLVNSEGGVLSMETAASSQVVLSAESSPFTLEGTEELSLSLDVAALVSAHPLDQPLGMGMHIVDPLHTSDPADPSPLQTSTSLFDTTGEELASGHE